MSGPLLASLARRMVQRCTRQTVLTMRISLPPSSTLCAAASRQFNTSPSLLLEHDKTLFESALYEADFRQEGNRKYYIDLKEGREKYVKISEVSRGKRATIMVDLQYLHMFTSKLMVAESGEKVGTLDAGNKSYDFHLEPTDNGTRVVVTENSNKKFKVYFASEIVQELTKKLVDINDMFEQ